MSLKIIAGISEQDYTCVIRRKVIFNIFILRKILRNLGRMPLLSFEFTMHLK